MFLAGANILTDQPAAFALQSGCGFGRNLYLTRGGRLDADMRDDEDRGEFILIAAQQIQPLAGGPEADVRLEWLGNRPASPCLLQGFHHLLAYIKQASPACSQFLVPERLVDDGKGGQVHALGPALDGGQVAPCLLGGVYQDWRQHGTQRGRQFVQHGLRGTTSQRVGRAGIETVFEHIQVERAQIHGAEVVDLVIGAVECIGAIRLGDRAHHFLQPMQHPAVDLRHLGVGHGVCHRIEAIAVGQAVAQGVAQAAVDIGDALQDLIAQAHILGVVRGGDPEAEHIGAVALYHLVWRDRVAARLVHRMPFGIEKHAMGDDSAVGSKPERAHADHQR